MSFSTDIDRAINSMVTGQKTAVKNGFTTFQAAIEDEQLAYEATASEKTWFNEQLLDLARELASKMQ